MAHMRVKRAISLVAIAATIVGVAVLFWLAKVLGDFYEMPGVSTTRAVLSILIALAVAAALFFEAYRLFKSCTESRNM
jgi:predicted tellurium resistance membrane protein TerC